jgi:hypothetical protein
VLKPIGRYFRSFARVDYPKLILAIGLGTIGGAIFTWLEAPLAWMIGAMVATSIGALSGAPLAVPKGLRAVMVAILGIMLGSAFKPEILDQIALWSVSIAGLVPFAIIAGVLGYAFLRRVGNYDPVSGYFTAMPGGFNEMVMVGGAMGGDERTIALSHSLRVMMVVFSVPPLFTLIGGLEPGDAARSLGPAMAELPLIDWAILAACAGGIPVAYLIRMPAPLLTGPMMASAIIHLAGLTEGRPPALLVAAAQVVIGSFIGARFTGTRFSQIAHTAAAAVGLTLVFLAVAVAMAGLLHAITGLRFLALLLAYMPGGLAEMSLVALTLGIDAAFVSVHHVLRILLIIAAAPLAFQLIRRWQNRRAPPDD